MNKDIQIKYREQDREIEYCGSASDITTEKVGLALINMGSLKAVGLNNILIEV